MKNVMERGDLKEVYENETGDNQYSDCAFYDGDVVQRWQNFRDNYS